jgi:hypothetical protein
MEAGNLSFWRGLNPRILRQQLRRLHCGRIASTIGEIAP